MALRFRSSPFVALAAGTLAIGSATADAGPGWRPVPPPLPWQEPAPLARLFLQLPFEGPELECQHAADQRR